MGLEDATEAKLPFGLGEIDLTNPVQALVMLTAVTLGFVAYHLTDSIGNQGANWLSNKLAAATGSDVGSAESGMTFGEA